VKRAGRAGSVCADWEGRAWASPNGTSLRVLVEDFSGWGLAAEVFEVAVSGLL
jgi:hypothetical protein